MCIIDVPVRISAMKISFVQKAESIVGAMMSTMSWVSATKESVDLIHAPEIILIMEACDWIKEVCHHFSSCIHLLFMKEIMHWILVICRHHDLVAMHYAQSQKTQLFVRWPKDMDTNEGSEPCFL